MGGVIVVALGGHRIQMSATASMTDDPDFRLAYRKRSDDRALPPGRQPSGRVHASAQDNIRRSPAPGDRGGVTLHRVYTWDGNHLFEPMSDGTDRHLVREFTVKVVVVGFIGRGTIFRVFRHTSAEALY